MKKITVFLFGLLLFPVMLGSLFMAGAIFNSSKKIDTETYFFQPDNNPAGRPGVPASPSDLGGDTLLNMLIERFVTEYFYVIPDVADVDIRTQKNPNSALFLMAGKRVFEDWVNNVAPEIKEMAESKMLRLVSINNIEKDPNADGYWIVSYTLATWPQPNNFAQTPIVTQDVIYMNIIYEPDIRTTILTTAGDQISIEEVLEEYNDPAVAFKFNVSNIGMYNK